MNFRKFLLLTTLFCAFAINSFAADFYWVGSNGDWHNSAHWSNISGGNGGFGIPSENDNIFFDKNSSNSIITISANVSVRNFIIEEIISGLTIKSNTNTEIDIYGKIDIKGTFTNNIYSNINFKSNQNNSINLNFGWYRWNSDFTFDGTGTYTFTSPLQSHNNKVTLKKGTLDLKGNDILCSEFISNSSEKRKLISDRSTILAYNFWKTNKQKFNYNFSQTTIYVLSSLPSAINKDGDNYTIKQSAKGPNDKTINAASVGNDTVSCGNTCDGELTVNFTTTCATGFVDWLPGAGDTYTGECGACAIAGPNGSNTISNLCPGIYTAVITNNCDGDITAPQAEVSGHPSIVPLLQNSTSPQCNGDCDGSTNIIVTGAPYADFTYLWLNQGPNDTLQSLSNLCAGPYDVEVNDGYGCIDTFNFIVTEPDSMYANVTVIDPLCFGECSGSATSNPAGGTAPFSFSWTPATGNPAVDTLPTFNNLCNGVAYTVNVTDASGCTNDTTITPVEPPQMQIDTTIQDVSCGGLADGSITVTVLSGGVAPYNHSWSTGQTDLNSASSTINTLIAGNYSDTITDANGCDTVLTFTITEPVTITTTTNPTDISCFGLCDGTAKTTVSGGTPIYTYVWASIPGGQPFNGQGTDSIFNLCAGQYFVTITDANTCSVSDTVTITEPPVIVPNASSTDITCPGFDDGTATANPTGGTGNPAIDFTYNWSPVPACYLGGTNTQSINSLCAGEYVVTITDSAGCTIMDTVNIAEPPALNLVMNSTDETCFNACDAGAGVTATGGTGSPAIDFTYLWTSIPGGQVTTGQGTDSIFNLCAGTYTVIVTDSVGCTANNNVVITPLTTINGNLISSSLTCNGICNGTATVSPTGGTAPYTVSWDGGAPINIPAAGSNTINTLCAGAHTALITDDNGCTLPLNFNLTEPPLLTTSSVKNDVSCFGLCDGDATTTPAGGTPPYSTSWDMIPTGAGFPNANNPINTLCAGLYFVTVTDDSLCTVTDTVEIFEPLEIFPNATSTDISCNGLTDGTATSLPAGGSPGYTFSWSGPGAFSSNSQSINSLVAGEYIVTVTDTNGCSAMDTVNILDPPVLTVSAAATAASCGAVCDGTAFATVNGGTPGFSFVWTGPSGPINGNPATGLCVGIYTVTVTDTNGCTTQDTTEILPLIQITINPTIIGISCNGNCDGTATVFPVGGTIPYTYLWDAPPTNTNPTVTGLCPGFISVTVTDAIGCSVTDSVEMPVDPSVLQTGATILQQISCAGACDAQVTHSPTGGTPPYSSVWTLPFGNDTNNVCPTSAIITVTDNNNCVQSDTLAINEPPAIIPNDVVTDVLCNGDLTGAITLNPTGGAGGETYVWVPNVSNTNSATGLGAGIYQITVTDANGCSILVTDTVNEPPVLSAIPVGVDISCFGLCDGMATVIVNGGMPGYTYSWAPNGQVSDTLFNLCAPNLTNSVTVTDANGCITSQTITINEPTDLVANVTGTPLACDGTCIGTALSTPSGGTPGYTFQWSANAAPNVLTNSDISNLCLGTYLVTVTDASGCTDTSSYTVAAPPALSVSLDSTNITCNGYNNGTATATVNGGTAPFVFSWVGGNAPATDTNFIDNLQPGTYTVTVTDANNCVFVGSVNILEPNPIDDNEVVVNANCNVNDGSITMFPSGGTPPYTHSWNTGSSNNPLQNLSAGFYSDTITDALGCTAVFTIPITNPAGPSGVTPTVNDATCFGTCDGSLNVIVIGGAAPFNYAWTSTPAVGPYPNDSTINNLCAGTYNLTLTEVNTGCILAETIVVGQADSISENSTFTDVSCNGTCDGTASVTPTGGTAPYTFLWSTGATASSVSGLCAGPASVTITDFNNCTKIVNFTIGTPIALTATTSVTATTCNGTCDGTATANPAGGTGPYSFQWNDPAAQTNQTATGLCPGTFNVIITDNNGCSITETVTVIDATPILANEATTNSTCGNADGTASVCAVSGGTGPYTFDWTTLGNVNVCNVAGLAAGTYPVIITDAGGCSETFLITISDLNGPVVTVNSINATCNGVCDGTATASATGTPNFSYLWQTGGQVTPSITGLCAGNYSVEVTDGNGCITTEPVVITDNTAITATVSTTEPTCNGDCDGTALITPNGGIPPYSYSWTGGNAAGQTINAVGGLCAGNYTATITDALGCSFIQNVTINEPNLLSVSTSGVAANCNGSCDGQATSTPLGGTAPYTFSWSNGNTTQNITALCAGSYTVTVTDANGCSATSIVTIGDGILITATATQNDANCGLCDGDITVTPGGGSGAPYTFLWSPGGETTAAITNLCPGAYSVDITDNAGCSQTFNYLINNANGPTLTTQGIDVTCFGDCDGLAFTTVNAGNAPYIFQWDDPVPSANDSAVALCAGLYNIVVQDAVGCITVDSVTINQPTEILANAVFTAPTCNGVCDGTATVSPTNGIGPYTVSWDGAPPIAIAIGTSNTITGLCAGPHTALITDANNCSITEDIILTDPTIISITASATSVSCNGDCDGTAIANASGGAPGYSYSWNTSPVQNNSLIGGLCPGNYTVTVTDNNGCTNTESVTVIDPPVLTTSSTPTLASCNGVCDASITTTPAGGSAPYRYVWSNGDTTQTINGLCVGIYSVIIIDANNCSVNDTVTITDPLLLDAGLSQTDPTCGVCDGIITSTPVGGTGPYNFVWTDPLNPAPPIQSDLGVATSSIVGLCAATYDLEVTDLGTGCISTYNIILNSANGPTLALTATDETCTTACDGTATATPTGGTTPFTYSWTPTGPPTITNQTATNLCVGLYTSTVTDSAGCITSDTISINTSNLDLTITSVVPETCFGDCDGSATVSATGGTPTYTFLWDANAANQATPQALNLCVGSYTVTVTDAANCSNAISTNITGPDVLTATATINVPLSCFGNCDGAVIANVLGGTPNYTYLWDDPLAQTTQIATGLCAGSYTVIVTDDNGCSATSTITLTDPTPILANETLTTPACGVCDGSITINPTGGTGPYSFLWTTPTAPILTQPVTASITNLCAGAYSVSITDALGCSTTVNFPLSNTNAPIPSLTSTPPSCNGDCDGSITSNTTGGTLPYNYFWNPNGAITPDITGLCAGLYTVNVTDAAGCIGVAIDSLIEPDVLQANLTGTNINCNGVCDGTASTNVIGGTSPYTYTWSPSTAIDSSITGLCTGTHIVTVTDINGCNVSDSIDIIEPTLITATSIQIDAGCSSTCDGEATVTAADGTGPYTFQWNGNTTPGQSNTQTTLCFGVNTVEVFDQNGCSIIHTINIGAADTVLADAGVDTTICIGDVANLNGVATGASITNVEWFSLPGMISIGTTDSITTTPSSTGVFCFVYQVTGACVVSDTVCITVEELPTADAGPDENIFEGQSTILNATGGATYTWSPVTGLSDTTIFNPEASPEETTTYFVTVTSPNGCTAIDSVTITVLPTINFPDGISPNGDGKNDVWIIDFIEEYPDNVVEIYNRWGELLFHADGYQQDWDGTYEGKELPIGTYYYIIDLNDESVKPFTGPLTILR
ncbi:MAG: gliding motility-associated C-terminal domain-containing protein [Vicingaceae bacterium]|nr:gliding motility-associated C-terminal domain-containing protein [Vicingaceae bacterium]